ncbi:MAG: TonB-dependent receptor [Chitinophagaceae bacterium]|nr:TonB-dependent receptor [Chitinophagaceae bacterium]
MYSRLRLLLSVLFITAFISLNAQSVKLSGKVMNEKNEPLAGANIIITNGASKQAISDVEGKFYFTFEAGVKHTLVVSRVGYATKEISEVEALLNQDNYLEIILKESSTTKLEGVTITATSRRQENTSALLSFQRNSTALSSGLAADFIRRTPDKNTGEVLKRVSGTSIQDGKFVIVRGLSDRYNSAVINNAQLPSTEPDKKAFSFDVIPSALIDNIIINKTATPELPGEFAGGLIQINTKDVPTRNLLSVGVSWGFNTQSVFKDFTSNERNGNDWLGFDDRTRGLPKGFPTSAQAYRALGGTTTGIQQQIEYSKLFNNDVYNEKNSTALPTQTYNLTWGSGKKFKNGGTLGTILSLQYRNSMLKYDVERRLHENDGDVLVQLFDEQNRYSVNVGALANITYIKGRHKISFKNLFNQLFEDNYYTRGGVSNDRIQDINFRSSVLNQRSLYSGQVEGNHQLTNSGIKLMWNGNFAYNWKSQPDLRTSAYFRGKGTNDPFEFNDDDTRRFYSDLKDYSYGANGSLSIPFTFAKQKQTFKAGGSTLIRIRDFRSRIFRYEPASISQFDATKNLLPYNQIFAPENMATDGFKILDFTNNQDKYFGVSILNGIFGMFDNKFGEKVRLVWGARVENFQQFLTTRDVTAKRVVVNTEKWDVLPSFNFTLSPNSKHSIRVAGSRTVARPEFREIAPFSFFDYEVNYAVNGNPDLKRSSILNGDIRYEFYPKGGEAITVGAFYKNFDDPIELRLNPSSVLDRRNYEYTNADKAITIGAEFEVRKNLDFLNQSLTNFSVFANLTYIYSKVTLASTSSSGAAVSSNRPLQGQSPYLVNLGLQYNSKQGGWNGSLLYNRIGQRLALVGINDLGFPDVYERPRDQVDIQIAKKIFNNRGELKLTWADLLNPAYYFYENTDSKKAFSSGNDRLFYSYKPGSTISIGFTYDFNVGKNNSFAKK